MMYTFDPRKPDGENPREVLREKVAAQHGFQPYKRYSEKHAAELIGLDYSTLKRKRRTGLVPFIDLGGGSVGYMGYHIADIILFGVKAKEPWVDGATVTNSNAANGGSAPRPADADISAAGPKDGRSPVSALALLILTKRKNA
jgi:hypothetical protein